MRRSVISPSHDNRCPTHPLAFVTAFGAEFNFDSCRDQPLIATSNEQCRSTRSGSAGAWSRAAGCQCAPLKRDRIRPFSVRVI